MWECFVGDAMWGMLCGGYYEVGYFVAGNYKVGYYVAGILCGGYHVGILCGGYHVVDTVLRILCRDTLWGIPYGGYLVGILCGENHVGDTMCNPMFMFFPDSSQWEAAASSNAPSSSCFPDASNSPSTATALYLILTLVAPPHHPTGTQVTALVTQHRCQVPTCHP